MDQPAPLPRDLSVRAVNHAKGEWLRKAKEDKKRKQQRKLQAREQGEDTDSDEDDGDDDEVVDDIEWDNLEDEDALIGISSSLQASRPFLFHEGEGTSRELAEVGPTIGAPRNRQRRGVPSSCPRSQ